jgi:hypothetical protein
MRLGGVIVAVAVALVLTGSGSAGRLRTADLLIDKIGASFSEPDRATTYSVAVHETDSKARCTTTTATTTCRASTAIRA